MQIVTEGSEVIITLSKTFLRQWNYNLLTTHKFFWKNLKIVFSPCVLFLHGVLQDEFLWSAKFFHRKIWILKNIFNIYHITISPIVQEIFTFLSQNSPHSSVMIRCIIYIWFVALKSLKTVLWPNGHQFWEVDFLWIFGSFSIYIWFLALKSLETVLRANGH